MADILVTGGAGYIGTHTVRELIAQGYNVVIFDNLVYGHKEFVPENVEFIEGDLADQHKLNLLFDHYEFCAVVHFAAYAYVGESIKEPAKYFNNNITNGLKLLNVMLNHKVTKMIFSSSCSVYGIPSKIPITESMPRNPVNPYGLSKMIFERILESYDTAYGLKSISLRYFNAAGAMPDASLGEWHEPETHAIPLMLRRISKGSFKVFGDDYPTRDGSCIRDYIHVCDLADAHVVALSYLLDGKQSNRINLGTGNGVSVFELIDVVNEITGMELDYTIAQRRQGDPPELVADPTKALEVLGWKARSGIYDIVRDAWNWNRKRSKI